MLSTILVTLTAVIWAPAESELASTTVHAIRNRNHGCLLFLMISKLVFFISKDSLRLKKILQD